MRLSREAVARKLRMLEWDAYRVAGRWPARVRCPMCGWSGARFAPSNRPRRPNRICPQCRCTERYRALQLYLDELGTPPPGTRLLEVAPLALVERSVTRRGYTYTSIDLCRQEARVLGDLTRLPFADGSFDLIVCFHVLEHIVDDRQAVSELVRVLAPDGRGVIIVPFDPQRPETFEVEGADPSERLELYGQADHVRIYGADVEERWRSAGVAVEIDPWHEHWDDATADRAAIHGNDDRFWYLRHPSEDVSS